MPPLVSAGWLNAYLQEHGLIVVDIRSAIDGGAAGPMPRRIFPPASSPVPWQAACPCRHSLPLAVSIRRSRPTISVPGGLALTLANLALIGALLATIARKRGAGFAPRRSMVIGGIAISLLSIAVFIAGGHPWSVTFGYTV